ncbi:hypothetical protein ACPOL_0617 [Acidisarcina polymorpha]|uniref:Uncharacterized protein n=1 Tax=Acidisarcina polymorpha TaxID=2211140 RepID=A0A2Z5FT26_9BACT|nr:hypothetical protein ACPOL_0617 [Acidisarcina polymorpha]
MNYLQRPAFLGGFQKARRHFFHASTTSDLQVLALVQDGTAPHAYVAV